MSDYQPQTDFVKKLKITSDSGFDYLHAQSLILSQAAGKYSGLTIASAGGLGSNGINSIRITPPPSGGDTATVTLSVSVDGTTFPVTGTLKDTGPILLGPNNTPTFHLKRTGKPDLILSASLDQTGDSYSINGTITEKGTARSWAFAAAHSPYTKAADPLPPFINVPDDIRGAYTVLIKPKTGGPGGIGWGC